MDELTWKPAWQLRDLMASGELSPVEVTDHFLARIEKLDPVLRVSIAQFTTLEHGRLRDRHAGDGRDRRRLETAGRQPTIFRARKSAMASES